MGKLKWGAMRIEEDRGWEGKRGEFCPPTSNEIVPHINIVH